MGRAASASVLRIDTYTAWPDLASYCSGACSSSLTVVGCDASIHMSIWEDEGEMEVVMVGRRGDEDIYLTGCGDTY